MVGFKSLCGVARKGYLPQDNERKPISSEDALPLHYLVDKWKHHQLQ